MNDLKKILTQNNILLIVFISFLILQHICTPNIFIGDDILFSKAISESGSILDFLSKRYENWSSRIFIEFVIIVVLHTSFYLWKILNILIWILLAKSISKICRNDNYIINGVIYGLVLAFPIKVINNTGWAATTMNYLWVVSLGCYVISVIVDYIDNKKISFLKMFFYLLACLYSTNQEQMAVVVILTLMAFLIYEIIRNKSLKVLKSRKTLIALILITVFNLILILLCPGNYLRKEKEVDTWFPEYNSFNLLQKVELGLTSTMNTILLNANIFYVVLTLMIFIGICIINKNHVKKIISAIPFLTCIQTIFLKNNIKTYFRKIYLSIIKFQIPYLISEVGIMMLNDILIFVIYISILFIIPISMFWVLKNRKLAVVCIGAYILGLITRFIMGFSPTVFASGERTFIFLYVAFIICTALIFKNILDQSRNK